MTIIKTWETQVFGHFMELVHAPYGDFDSIGRLSNAINDSKSLKQTIEVLVLNPQARRAFQERSLLGNINLQQLHELPKNTLGYLYADHMLRNNLKPIFTQAQAVNDNYSYLVVHIAETHDIWHVVTDSDTNMAGEIQLQAFYVAQLHASRFWLAMLSKNLLKTAVEDIELSEQRMDALAKGWIMGKQAKPLFGIPWNSLWQTPLEQLREQLNLNV